MNILAVVFLLCATVAFASPAASLSALLRSRLIQEPTEIESRIIGGETVATHVAPYLASLSISPLVYAHACAATIIGKEWLLTAAHCLDELTETSGSVVGLPVYAGMHNRSQTEEAQVTHINWAFSHKEFTGKEGSDDIALLHVHPPFVFTERVQQITLPYINEQFEGLSGATYGWGLDDPEAGKYVKELQVARSEVVNVSDCRAILPDDAPVSAKEICVKVSACYGDGGSPLVVESAIGAAPELAGITSWGYLPCGYEKRPTVYTAVSPYIDWIAQVQWAYYILH